MLLQTINTVGRIIEWRPTVRYYIEIYRGDELWGEKKERSNYKITYVNYLQTQLSKNSRNRVRAIEEFLRKKNFWNQKLIDKMCST